RELTRIGVAALQLSVYLLRHAEALGQDALDRGQCRLGLLDVGTAGLRHIGAAAAAFAAERRGTRAHQLDRIEAVGQIRGDADDDGGLAFGARHDRDDAGADAPFQIVGKRAQIATGHIVDEAAVKGDRPDLLPVGAGPRFAVARLSGALPADGKGAPPVGAARTSSPYFSPSSARAPSATACSGVNSRVRTSALARIWAWTAASMTARSSAVSGRGWLKSKRSRSGATSEPFCVT